MDFVVEARDPGCKARAGILSTSHGDIATPVFMPVGTAGTVKAIHHADLAETIRARIILGNTYHLYLRPGLDVLKMAGGLHQFMSWDKPILTDSGGYQVYSLAHRRKLTEEGVTFQSHIDGSRHMFSPEKAIDIQRIIGADIIMAFDECTPYPCDHDYARSSMHLTHRWLDRCETHFRNTSSLYGHDQSLFPIVQGSTFSDLRKESAHYISEKQCHGNAIGGLSVGEPAGIMYEITGMLCEILPEEKPRYLMGVGTPANILECISLGIDMFDCVMPTRNGRNGMLFTKEGIINIKNNKWKNDFSAIDEEGTAYVDQHYSKAYLRHLFSANEMLGPIIASLHNLSFYLWLVDEARKNIQDQTFLTWKKSISDNLARRL
jgi:queuine tRNA-ribosyltransferase